MATDISFQYLVDYLEPTQKKIHRKGGITTYPLTPIFSKVLDDITEFHYIRLGKKHSFLYAIMAILVDGYVFHSQKEQFNFNQSLRKKMVIDLTEKDLYHKFGYHNRKDINRNFLQCFLLGDSCDIDSEDLKMIRKYIVEYFDINVMVFECVDMKSVKRVDWILSGADGLNNQYKPTVLVFRNNGLYYPIVPMSKDKSGIGMWDKDEWIKNLYEKFPIENYSFVLLEKNINELREIAIKRGLNTRKCSEKSHQMVLKSRNELLNDLI